MLIGKKVRGFKFEETEKGLGFHPSMESYIGKVGVIQSYDIECDCYAVDFDIESWRYPASLIEQHLVEEEHNDVVNNPSHYNKGGIECIDAIESSMTKEAFLGYLKGNVQKYLYRYESKDNPLQDVKKAQWYLIKLIEKLS